MKKISIYCLSVFFAITTPSFSKEAISKETIINMVAKRDATISEERMLQIKSALAAFGSIKAKRIVYISSPITSGKRLYDYMDAHGYRTIEEAKNDWDQFFRSVMLPNIEEGAKTSTLLAGQIDGVVIAPTSFENQKVRTWGQNEFMSMWLSVIEEKVTEIVMLDGWQYSNGSSEEYLWAVLMQHGLTSRTNIEIVDAKGDKITLEQGREYLSDALVDMQRRGIKATVTEEVLSILSNLEILNKSLQDNF